VPEWYFLPFYAILRSIPNKLGGVVAMISAILILLFLPLINFSEVRSSKFRPIYSFFYWFLVSDFILLGWIGQKPVETPYIEVGMFATFFYFVFFIFLMPLIGFLEGFLVKFDRPKTQEELQQEWEQFDIMDEYVASLHLQELKGEEITIKPPFPPLLK
jgi:quinol-cytochrome oxidoreductase complex cytochrome b subunit